MKATIVCAMKEREEERKGGCQRIDSSSKKEKNNKPNNLAIKSNNVCRTRTTGSIRFCFDICTTVCVLNKNSKMAVRENRRLFSYLQGETHRRALDGAPTLRASCRFFLPNQIESLDVVTTNAAIGVSHGHSHASLSEFSRMHTYFVYRRGKTTSFLWLTWLVDI